MDKEKVRGDFPILGQMVNGHKLIYLDNAATTQVPTPVLDAMVAHYQTSNGNVHRGIHTLSERSSEALEAARKKIASFIGASTPQSIVFTQGATDSLNMVALGLESRINAGDEVVVTELEHHSNFVPWQQVCLRKGALLKIIPQVDGVLDMAMMRTCLSSKTKVVAVTHVSNLTGTVNPLSEIIDAAHGVGALVVVDGAQAVRHEAVDVDALGCDFYCFSGHKMLSLTGIGVLYGKRESLELLDPVKFGGGMVDIVGDHESTFGPLPFRFEAGTGSYAEAIALGASIDYMNGIGHEAICSEEQRLLAYLEEQLSKIPDIRILGAPERRAGCLSFVARDAHPYDIASILDKYGIAVRSGNHCAQPGLRSFGVKASTRISPAFYNTADEIDVFMDRLEQTLAFLHKWGGGERGEH